MFRNRLIDQVETPRLPRPPLPQPSPAGFVLCPVFTEASAAQAVYRLALEQAQAVVRPSLPERDLLAAWN